MDLRQRKLFTTKEFTFKDSGLHIKIKNLTSSQEVEIPFEEINSKKAIRQSKTDYVIIVVGLFFGLVFIINFTLKIIGDSDLTWGPIFLMFLFTTLSALIAYVNSKKQILIPTVNNGLLEIFDGRPSKEITDNFVTNLTIKSNDYLKRKYGTIDRYLPVEPQLTNLMWLKEQDILKDEFEELKSRLLGRQGTSNPIGF